jgi:hypothetical protein
VALNFSNFTFREMTMFRNHRKLIQQAVLTAGTVVTFAAGTAAQAATINFNTDAAGNAYTGLSDFFAAGEYAALGVTLNDSDPAAGSTYVNLVNPVNAGTAISGYYVNVGAFDGTSTFLDLQFGVPVTSVMFDFATPDGQLDVAAYGSGGALIANLPWAGADIFVNQAGFNVMAGQFALSGVGPISRLLISPSASETLIFDNLQFTPVPLPAAAWLFASGLLGLAGIARHKQRTA